MSYIKDISLFIVIGLLANLLSFLAGTDFLICYLKNNLTTIQLGLMAINTATCGLIVSKLQEIKEKHRQIDLKPITTELLSSLKEQIILIVLGIIFMLLINSEFIAKIVYSVYFKFALETLLISVFVNSIQVLWDTGKAVFVIIDIMNDVD